MNNLLNETKFEELITSYLAGSDLYNQRSSAQFDIEKLCDVEMLEQLLFHINFQRTKVLLMPLRQKKNIVIRKNIS